MKKLILLCLLLSTACDVEQNTPVEPVIDDFEPTPTTVLLKEGTMVGVNHTASGTVKIYDDTGKKIVVLDPFSSQNGPDLKVYLSIDENATRYVNLGPLKSTMGKQSYDVNGMPDLAEYKFVLIWCEKFSVIFGKAEMM
jgi:hypothetical protein